ncbi:MAG: TRC40/GET3/ArsA family transport-energizing ATPase [Bacillota bacterium]
MSDLDHPLSNERRETHFIFFSGKGGVGKTSMACATAVHLAEEGKNTLIVTTDPASNLADVFRQEIGHWEAPIHGIPGLRAMEIDPDRATEEYRERIIGPMRLVMPPEITRVIEEQFRSPCTTEIAAFDRFVDFMDDSSYDVVIFDTAPTGHTIRLLELPVDWSRHIEESAQHGGQTCMGPVEAIQGAKAKYDRAIRFLRDAGRTTFIFVVQPEQTPIFEAERAMKELGTIGVRSTRLIVNGIIPEEEVANPLFAKRLVMQRGYMEEIARRFPMPTTMMPLMAVEIQGTAILSKVGGMLFKGATEPVSAGMSRSASVVAEGRPASAAEERASSPDVRKHLTEWPAVLAALTPGRSGRRLLFFTGKGGVGKTVIASATAVRLAESNYRTLLVSTDPASHLSQAFAQEIGAEVAPVAGQPGLHAARVDQKKAAQEYRERILSEARGRYSDDMLEAMREELESPCTEDMAAFEKFVRYATLTNYDVIVFDTAPTGHTLRLLELPMEWDKQVEIMVSTKPGTQAFTETKARFDQAIGILRDPGQTTFVFVVYPEYTPIIEAFRASQDLLQSGIKTGLVVANLVLPAEHRLTPLYTSRYELQQKYLGGIQKKFGVPMLVMPLLDEEIKGLPRLKQAATVLFGDELQRAIGGR